MANRDETCPQCQSKILSLLGVWTQDYVCGSFLVLKDDAVLKAGEFSQSDICARIAALAAEVERLSAELDDLPALDGDGKWEKLRAELDARRAELHRNYPFTIEEGVLDRIVDEMDRLTSGDAAKGE